MDLRSGFSFRLQNYAYIAIKLLEEVESINVYLDTSYNISLINREQISSQLLDTKVLRIASPLSIHGVGSNKHKTSEFVIILIYFLSKKANKEVNDIKVLTLLTRELYIINSLRAYILISNNIISPENIIINITNK